MREQIEFRRGQVDGLVTDPHPATDRVHRYGSDRYRFTRTPAHPRTPHEGLDARNHLPGAEGFGHVVVRPQFQTKHAIDFVVSCGAEDDRHPVVFGAQLTTDLGSIHTGQAHVEHDRNRMPSAGSRQSADTVEFGMHAEPLTGQVEAKEVRYRFLIFDDENQPTVGHVLRVSDGHSISRCRRLRKGTQKVREQ